jgi:hypothetical protein
MPEIHRPTLEEQLEHVRKIGADVMEFRRKHPESPLAGPAWHLSGLVGRVEGELIRVMATKKEAANG